MKKIVLLFIILALVLTSCKNTERVTKQGFYFDTLIKITVDDKDLSSVDEAFLKCDKLENIFSRTKDGSELKRINEKGGGVPSLDMQTVLDFSLSFSQMSKGAFDISIAPLTSLWNVKNASKPPEKEEIQQALNKVGYEKITLSPFNTNSAQIDLGAVAKGYAADCLRDYFEKQGLNNVIIDLGGNVALIGEYTVGIRDPFNPDKVFKKITLKDKSAVTSGAYQRYFEFEGKRYHHIINPHTGYPAESGLKSVTVISPSSMQADALSTAIYVLGEKGLSLCNNFPDTDALLITDDKKIITTDGFKEKYNLRD